MRIQGWMMIGMLLISGATWGQNEPSRFQEAMAKMKADRVSFLTDKLQLTVEEAQQFWPVYNEMNKKSDEIEVQIRTIVQNYKKNKETLSITELETMSDKMMELQSYSTKLDAEYYQKYKKVLPIRKIMELNQAEREFKHELLKQLKGCTPAKE